MSENLVLRRPANRVSSRAPWLWAASAAASAGAAAAVAALLSLIDVVTIPGWVFVLYAVLAIGYVVAMPAIRYRVHRWESTETAVYTQSGWITQERRIAPMSRIQTVDFEQGPVSRMLGLASVTVTTASAAGPLEVGALDRSVADRLVEELTRRVEAERGDAT